MAPLLVLAIAAPAAARNVQTYHGTWDSVTYSSCSGEVLKLPLDPPDVSTGWDHGNWNVAMKDDGTAEVSVIIFTQQGRIHASWGGNDFHSPWMVESATGRGFSLLNQFTMATPDGPITMTLRFVLADNTLTYTLSPWCPDGSAAFLTGHQTH